MVKKSLDVCYMHNLKHHIDNPTRITPNSSSCIDQIISNIPNFISQINNDPPVSTNDHNTIGIRLCFTVFREKS